MPKLSDAVSQRCSPREVHRAFLFALPASLCPAVFFVRPVVLNSVRTFQPEYSSSIASALTATFAGRLSNT